MLLTCELTDPSHRIGAVDDPLGLCVIGRSVKDYEALFYRLRLQETRPRRVEAYPSSDAGTYMLFAK
jgi:hypothetical protein